MLPDSGGPGRTRGGLGTRLAVRFHTAARMNAGVERTSCAPWGLAGGGDGAPNRVRIERSDGTVETFPNGKVNQVELRAGDRHVVDLGGGGGYGDPLDRPVDRVLADLRAGYVTPTAARNSYGVASRVQEDGSIELDGAATREQRSG